MNISRTHQKGIAGKWLLGAFVSFIGTLTSFTAVGQIAITEVMTNPSGTGVRRDDFWELTNFGTNAVDLSSFWFKDYGGFSGATNLAYLWVATPRIDSPVIGPHETILFVKAQAGVTTTPTDFRDWWGNSRLPTDLKIIFYYGLGFSSGGDALQLWQVTADRTNLLQRIDLPEASNYEGRTFTYNHLTGALDVSSEAGVDSAFTAMATDDVGSPGQAGDPVPLSWAAAPVSIEVDAGAPMTVNVRAYGLPAPRYQWLFNGSPIADATGPSFTVAAATSADAGQYSLVLMNGLERVITPAATITVNTQPRCATILEMRSELSVTLNQTAILHVESRGYPLPEFRWQFNGVDIPGATANTYILTDVDEGKAGLYTVHVSNPLCSTNASTALQLVPEAQLVVTEAMALPRDATHWHHNTWWELTNRGTNAVNLRGYRTDDNPGVIDGAVVVTNDVIIPPGQSAIFVSSMTPEAFRGWWGEENLPSDLSIISYSGNGLNPFGDMIRLWNPTALTDDEWLLSLSVVNLEIGNSLWFDPILAEFGELSRIGERGAFQAAESDDIGSPGWTSSVQRVIRPRIVSTRKDASGVTMTWKSQPGRTYELRYRDKVDSSDWLLVASLLATGDSLTAMDTHVNGVSQRFYKVVLIP